MSRASCPQPLSSSVVSVSLAQTPRVISQQMMGRGGQGTSAVGQHIGPAATFPAGAAARAPAPA
ncbi:hypothetical protein F751_6697 [Auxenochlorella protothecoides]|uniref:Uncharacterized protein n=1 Tax=Auxenochlorella protothecoides TaxID=3075 RepID=A0A087SQL8_AUXPR|nr:hypothetical protein F751_6697 [Auxenochlorella protothecoides]KFM28022.1 hypothetical protein F751_6697 [Auxenochlorella protothecoides]